MAPRKDSDEIIMKKSGKRARLEITPDDLSAERPPEAPPAPPARARPPAPPVPPPPPTPPASGGGPPTRYVHDGDDGGGAWWQSRSASVGAAVVLVLALLAVVAVVVLGGDDPKDQIATDLANAHGAVDDAMKPARGATTLVLVRNAGRTARQQIARLDSPSANLQNMDDKDRAGPVAALVDKERQYLNALATLQTVTQSVVEDADLRRWQSIKQRLEDAQVALVNAGAAVEKLRLPGDAESQIFRSNVLETTLTRVDATVTGARDKLAAFKSKLQAHRISLAKAKRRAGVVQAYRNNVVNILEQYNSDREEVSAWAEEADSITRSEADEATTKVEGFMEDRSATIARLRDTLDSAPAPVRSVHQGLGVPLRSSLAGLSEAEEAISTFAFDSSDEYDDLTETPAWIGFQDDSEAAAEQLEDARRLWASAVATEIQRLQIEGVLPRPKKPQI